MLQLETRDGNPVRFARQTIITNVSLINAENWQRIHAILLVMEYELMAPSQQGPEQISCDS